MNSQSEGSPGLEVGHLGMAYLSNPRGHTLSSSSPLLVSCTLSPPVPNPDSLPADPYGEIVFVSPEYLLSIPSIFCLSQEGKR